MQMSTMLRRGHTLIRLAGLFRPADAVISVSARLAATAETPVVPVGASAALSQLWQPRSFAADATQSAEDKLSSTGAAPQPEEDLRDANLDLSTFRAPEGWWENPEVDTAEKAYIIFDEALQKHRHLRPRHAQEVILRANNAADLEYGLKALEKLHRFRTAEQLHDPFNRRTTKLLVNKALELKAAEVAADGLSRFAELGLLLGANQAERVFRSLSNLGNTRAFERLLQSVRQAGVQPTSDMAFAAARCAQTAGQLDWGRDLIREFEVNGVRVRGTTYQTLGMTPPGQRDSRSAADSGAAPPGSGSPPAGASATSSAAHLQEAASGSAPSAGADAGEAAQESSAGADAGDADPAADPERGSEAGVGASAATGAPPGVAS